MSPLRTTIFSPPTLTAFGKGRTEIQQFTMEQLGFVSCILACQTAPRCPLYRGLLVPELPFLQAPVISGRNGSSRSSQGPGGKSGNRPGAVPPSLSHFHILHTQCWSKPPRHCAQRQGCGSCVSGTILYTSQPSRLCADPALVIEAEKCRSYLPAAEHL